MPAESVEILFILAESKMLLKKIIKEKAAEVLEVYWRLASITIPISIVAELLSRIGAIEAVAPVFEPVMNLVGLPPELGLAWLTAMVVGTWGAVPLLFTLVPVASLSIADMTVFSALVLFAHGLPLEQRIIQEAGPRIFVTTMLRITGGLVYAVVLHWIFNYTNLLSDAVNPAWIPVTVESNWIDFFHGLSEAMIWMFIILAVLSICLDILKVTGVLGWVITLLSPALRISGIHKDACHLTLVGLFLGITYGAGLIMREAQSNVISARQVFISCAFMGYSHSVVDDTILFLALGADIYGVFVGRIIFTVIATGFLACLVNRLSDKTFHAFLFR